MDFLAEVERALADRARPGIEGWGLSGPSLKGIGTWVETAPRQGCDSATCAHYSHDEAAARYRWLPPTGATLSLLGTDDLPERQDTYYLLRVPGEPDRYLVCEERRHFHAFVRTICGQDVPLWAILAPLSTVTR